MWNMISLALVVLVGSALTRPLNAQLLQDLEIIEAHAEARAQVGVLNPLVWDESLAEYASNRARELVANCEPWASRYGIYGENVAVASVQLPIRYFVKIWVDETVNYDYDSNSCAPGKYCGNYTQVVWRGSTKLGCKYVTCDSLRGLLVCNYDPRGNIDGEKPY